MARSGQAAEDPWLFIDGQKARAVVTLCADRDDDDDDGVIDALQATDIPADELLEIRLPGRTPARVRVGSGMRLVRRGQAVGRSATIRAGQSLHLQAVEASGRARGALRLERAGRSRRYDVHVVGMGFLNAKNRTLDPSRHALGVSRRVTNDSTLPRDNRYDRQSADPENVRIEVFDPRARGDEIAATLESIDPATGESRSHHTLLLHRPERGVPFRSPFVRLVGDEVDEQAPGVRDRVLRVALRDRIRVSYRVAEHVLTQDMRVGRPGDERTPRAARRAELRVVVMRTAPGGPPVIGVDEASAIRLVRDQIATANDIWLQCFITFGDPEQAQVRVEPPPLPSMLSVGDGDGLPARGGGRVAFRVGRNVLRGVETRPGALPVQTALSIAEALHELGFVATVTENPPAEFGAGRSADILVRAETGEPVAIEPIAGRPLSTDARQHVAVGVVDLSDGLAEFNNMTASSGTLEERALIKNLHDEDPATIDLFIVNRFTQGTRQGEAFIEGSGGSIINTLLLDRNGLRQERTAWTLAHEVGHVLLDQAFHPDNVGPDLPFLLMDADNNSGTVNGPKRLTEDECEQVRTRSGIDAVPALLKPHD